MNTLAIRLEFSEEDINMGLAMLAKMKLLPEGADKSYFTEGEPVQANLSEMCKDDPDSQAGEICLSMMASIVAMKEKKKEDATANPQ